MRHRAQQDAATEPNHVQKEAKLTKVKGPWGYSWACLTSLPLHDRSACVASCCLARIQKDFTYSFPLPLPDPVVAPNWPLSSQPHSPLDSPPPPTPSLPRKGSRKPPCLLRAGPSQLTSDKTSTLAGECKYTTAKSF